MKTAEAAMVLCIVDTVPHGRATSLGQRCTAQAGSLQPSAGAWPRHPGPHAAAVHRRRTVDYVDGLEEASLGQEVMGSADDDVVTFAPESWAASPKAQLSR